MPRFSILIPCFNAETMLEQTVKSLQAQTLTDWECLLIDDGSTDGTQRIMEQAIAADPRFRMRANPGKGPSDARNLALSDTRAPLIAFCDADDLWVPEKLAHVDAAFADGTLAASYGRVAFFNEGPTGATSSPPEGDLTIPTLLGENPVCTTSNIVVRRDVFVNTGGFDRRLVHNEDLEWLIRLIGAGHRLGLIDRVLVHYRTSPTGLSSDLKAMQASRAAVLKTARQFGHQSDAAKEAIHLRYLARRALRVDAPRGEAMRLLASGIATSPRGFFSDPRRGALICAAVLAANFLPQRARRALFAT